MALPLPFKLSKRCHYSIHENEFLQPSHLPLDSTPFIFLFSCHFTHVHDELSFFLSLLTASHPLVSLSCAWPFEINRGCLKEHVLEHGHLTSGYPIKENIGFKLPHLRCSTPSTQSHEGPTCHHITPWWHTCSSLSITESVSLSRNSATLALYSLTWSQTWGVIRCVFLS